jgi:hypothetical protein
MTGPPVHAGDFHREGICAERLATSMLRYTLACMTVATATAQMISNSTFDLRAYILWGALLYRRG